MRTASVLPPRCPKPQTLNPGRRQDRQFDHGVRIGVLPLHELGISRWDDGMACCKRGWRRLNPYAEYSYDGLSLNPLEVIFVKVKGFQVQSRWASAEMATTYDRWASAMVSA